MLAVRLGVPQFLIVHSTALRAFRVSAPHRVYCPIGPLSLRHRYSSECILAHAIRSLSAMARLSAPPRLRHDFSPRNMTYWAEGPSARLHHDSARAASCSRRIRSSTTWFRTIDAATRFAISRLAGHMVGCGTGGGGASKVEVGKPMAALGNSAPVPPAASPA
jgi:hypothetical protein